MSNSTYQWADLPKELLEMIGKCLDSRVDVLRFRAVCNSWRSTIPLPPFDQEIPPVILHLPPPIRQDALLVQTTVCRIELAPRFVSNSSSLSRAWLTKVGESTRGKLQLLDPILNNPTRYPFKLNLLDFRFQQLSKSFSLQQVLGHYVVGVNKVVLFPVSASCSRNEFGILAIYHEGKLGYWKNGDEKWTLLDDENFQYDDIIEYKGQFYVVDRWGTVSWIDSSLKLIQYSPPLYGCGGRKHLVESCGNIYVVDRYLDGARRTWIDHENTVDNNNNNILLPRFRKKTRGPKATDFRVYKLDEDWGTWVDVKSLGDQVFVLGIDCSFSFSYREFYGGKGDCIYFTDEDNYSVARGWVTDGISVFQLEDHSIEKVLLSPVFLEMFWPPNFGSK